VSSAQVRCTTLESAAATRPEGTAGTAADAGTTGFQPSLPARYFSGVAFAASLAVICGRFAFTVAPGPMFCDSEKRASCQAKGTFTPELFVEDMSSHGAAVSMAEGSQVSLITTEPSAFGSALGCHGRPRLTVPSAASLTILLPVMRKPYLLPSSVLAAVR
jgi:hypothetical protein